MNEMFQIKSYNRWPLFIFEILNEDKKLVNVLTKQLNNIFDQVKWHPWLVDFVALKTV